MPHLPQPARARGFTPHRAMRRVAKAAPVEAPIVVRRKGSRSLAPGLDSPAVEAPILASSDATGEI